ncbi:MAG: hypothetical protein K2J95_11320 [Lachnospiraceae bacterium]|nr:hypothetical protein [Lachnospiraceae bacterium]
MEQDIWKNIKLPEDMSKEKIDFLTQAVEGSRNLKKQELLPYLTRLIRVSKEKQLTFTDSEIQFIIAAIRSSSSPEQNQYIDQLMQESQKRMSAK